MVTHIGFQSLPVADFDRAITFYRDQLGFVVERDMPYGDSRWIFMEIPGARTKLHFERGTPGPNESRTPRLVLVARSVDKVCEKLATTGWPIKDGPADAPWNPGQRYALIDDSEGNLVLIETDPEAS